MRGEYVAKTRIYEEITASGPLGPPGHRRKGVQLTRLDKLFILWCKSQGVSKLDMSKRLPAARNTVHAYLERVFMDPRIALDLGMYQRLGKKRFECGFCGQVRPAERAMERHVLAHFLPYVVARDRNLAGRMRL